MMKRALSLLVVALGVAVIPATVAFAQTFTSDPIAIDCQPDAPNGQLCQPPFAKSVTTGGALLVEVVASPGHCSPIQVSIDVDGSPAYTSGVLNAGDTTGIQNFGPVTPGNHLIEVFGIGVFGGCNGGALGAWEGTLNVTVNDCSANVEIPGNRVDENCDSTVECDPCAGWQNHGKFVRCVAHAADALEDAGAITPEEGEALVSSAAQSDVGKVPTPKVCQ